MRLNWTLEDDKQHRFMAVTPRFRYVMVAPPRSRPGLMVQYADAPLSEKPISQRTCRSRAVAERMAQRFEDNPSARRLR